MRIEQAKKQRQKCDWKVGRPFGEENTEILGTATTKVQSDVEG